MKIAVLSGKGGTGKTLVSVNLAALEPQSIYVDCDVEEPNGHLFFKPQNNATEKVTVWIPMVQSELCNGCRTCVDFCKFNALAYIKDQLFIFPEICHSCGGCILFCPEGALSEKQKKIGEIRTGVSEGIQVLTGMLNIGEASGVPIIHNLLKEESKIISPSDTFIDCPPGSACIVMESIKDADYCLLVAEPTIFGAHNLAMVHELVKLFHKPNGVVLNKTMDTENPSEQYCKEQRIPIVGEIPYDTELGTLNSNGMIAVREKQKYRQVFLEILNQIKLEAGYETTTNP